MGKKLSDNITMMPGNQHRRKEQPRFVKKETKTITDSRNLREGRPEIEMQLRLLHTMAKTVKNQEIKDIKKLRYSKNYYKGRENKPDNPNDNANSGDN
jgi:hypothetical protein